MDKNQQFIFSLRLGQLKKHEQALFKKTKDPILKDKSRENLNSQENNKSNR